MASEVPTIDTKLNSLPPRINNTNQPSKHHQSSTPTTPPPLKIVIIGGGLGGLSATLSLLSTHPTSTIKVYERDLKFTDRRNGYGLTLTYNPVGPLGKLGVLECVAKRDCPSRSHYVFDLKGKLLGYYGRAFANAQGNGGGDGDDGGDDGKISQRGNMRVPRQVLRKILIDSVVSKGGDDVIQWGKEYERYTVNAGAEGKVNVYFKDGSVEGGVDVLVGADGVRSSVMKNLIVPPVSKTLLNKLKNEAAVPSATPPASHSHSHPTIPSYPHPQSTSTNTSAKTSTSRTPSQSQSPSPDGAYFGIMIVLGITPYTHPLIHERGFYTLSGEARLFTMPFTGGAISVNPDDDDDNTKEKEEEERLTMWQLSFSIPTFEEAEALRLSGPTGLKSKVMEIVKDWHNPVLDMVSRTEVGNVWGTPLLDRVPVPICRKGGKGRVVCLGDAIHAMSPFKGQGANQALTDGPLLSSKLHQNPKNIHAALLCFEREMISRTEKKVKESREKAIYYHSPEALSDGNVEDFAGVNKGDITRFLEELERRGVNAESGGMVLDGLDSVVQGVINEMNVSASGDNALKVKVPIISEAVRKENIKNNNLALEYARNGDVENLRILSSKASILKNAKTADGRNFVHNAVSSNNLYLVKWLITEFNIGWNICDVEGKTPLDLARGDLLRIGGDGEGIEKKSLQAIIKFLERERLGVKSEVVFYSNSDGGVKGGRVEKRKIDSFAVL